MSHHFSKYFNLGFVYIILYVYEFGCNKFSLLIFSYYRILFTNPKDANDSWNFTPIKPECCDSSNYTQ